MSGQPDPKPAARIVDPAALARARVVLPRECAACGHPASDPHHVIPKSEGGDDVYANLVRLCGSGSARCHGAWHGTPYVQHLRTEQRPFGVRHINERRDRVWVALRLGRYLMALRPDTIQYVLGKLGRDAGAAYLERVYLIEPVLLIPSRA